jgi:hypothetical protein
MNDALRLLDLADRAFEARAATRLHAVEAQTELKRVDPSGEI